MTETHHRVKNNLQIVAGMIELHLMEDRDFITADEVKKLSIHVHTLAAVHELLTQEAKDDGQAHYIPARQVLERLIEMLQRIAGSRHIGSAIAGIRLSAKQGASLALVVNELLSNALKYGKGDIEVELTVESEMAVLRVYDEGQGFPEDFDPIKAANTGLELVHNLSRWDLGGNVRFSTRDIGGGCVTVTIPLHE
jgi:two-component sensor histidine kinase